MKIRRYMGSSAQEAMLKVKMDLGNEAVILNTRKVRQKGLFKIFSKPMVEVLAAIDDDYGTKKEKVPPREERVNAAAAREPELKPPVDEKDKTITELQNKVTDMESLLQKISEQLGGGVQKKEQPKPEENKQMYPKVLQLFYNNLIKNEVEADLAKKIADLAAERVKDSSSVNETASVIYNIIAGILGKPDTIKLAEGKKPTVIIFVGPTGVGKTTTLAKIAANYVLNQKKTVGFVTADTYRIAAVEQLKTYAEILGIPVSVVYSPNEIKDAVSVYADRDLVMIDTAGRSHKNKSQFEELKALITASEADEIYLVLSTTTSIRNCREILSNYNFLKDYKLIFTKLDESPITGIMLNTKYLTGKNLSYITTGQSVPDDIEIANTDRITKNLLGSIS